jgi:outer membrane protein TolC
MPHPWERRARIQRASAEVMLAEGQYLAEEDDVVRAVRALFYDLSLLEGTLATQTKRRESYTTFRTEMESANIPDFAMDAARATGEMAKLLKSMFDNRADIDRTRVRLASLCGLPGTDRIRTGGVIMRRVVDTVTLDPGYLLDIAMLYRSDAVASRARLEIAKANLAQAQAGKIPWVTFFDAGFARQWDERRYGREDEWFFRVGIEIPIFDLAGINQRSREYKKAAAEWEQQMEKQRRRIEVDISLALERLRRAGRAMREVESEVRNMNRMLKSDADKVKAAGGGLSDYAKFKRAQYDAEDNMSILQISRYEAYSKYNEALMDLEDVIGVRIEKALHGIRDK